MLDKNYAGTTASIIRSTFPNITAPKQTDLVSMLDQVGKDYQTGLQVRADNKLTDEMIAQNPEDEARIRQMGGRAYADMLKSDAQRAEERQWHLDDLESQRQFQREQQDRSIANQMRMFNMRQQAVQQAGADRENQLKSALESGMITADEYNQAKRRDLLGEIAKTVEPDVTEDQSRKQAQDSINQLAGVAERNNIGIFTDWRRSHGLTGAETEREYGRISSAVAGLAPRAIAKLKEAGVSGINSLPEFMTYIGLPQNPTSAQIAGAIPMMAQIAGVDNPLANQPTQAQKMKGLFGKQMGGVQVGQQIGNFKVIGVE